MSSELASLLEEANRALTVVEQSRNDWHDKSDEQAKRIAELEGFLQKFVYLMGYGCHKPGDDYLWIEEKQKEAMDLLKKSKC